MTMVAATELRIGNYVLFNGKVISISPKGLYDLYYTSDYTGKHEPIKLTPELLEQCGFEKSSMTYHIDIAYSKMSYRKLCFSPEMGIVAIREGKRDDGRHNDDLIVIHNRDYKGELYLHQLQNIYYALTNEELPIKL